MCEMHFALRIQTWAKLIIPYLTIHQQIKERSFCVHRQGQEVSDLIVTFYGCCLRVCLA